MKEQIIKNIMKKSSVTVQYQTPLKKIINTLAEARLVHLPVVTQQNKLIGMVSQIDCHKALFSSVYHGEQTVKVNDIMLNSYITLSPDDNVTDVFLKTREETVNTFPVIKDGILVGVVDRVDLLAQLNKLTCHNARRIK